MPELGPHGGGELRLVNERRSIVKVLRLKSRRGPPECCRRKESSGRAASRGKRLPRFPILRGHGLYIFSNHDEDVDAVDVDESGDDTVARGGGWGGCWSGEEEAEDRLIVRRIRSC